jgi:hypothetical protein
MCKCIFRIKQWRRKQFQFYSVWVDYIIAQNYRENCDFFDFTVVCKGNRNDKLWNVNGLAILTLNQYDKDTTDSLLTETV